MQYDEAVFGFAPELVPLIKNGTKTLTYRLGKKKDHLQVGDTFLIEDSGTNMIFAEVELTSKEQVTFKDLSIDRQGHEIYSSKAHQRAVLEGYYRRPIIDEDAFLILEYKVLKLIKDN